MYMVLLDGRGQCNCTGAIWRRRLARRELRVLRRAAETAPDLEHLPRRGRWNVVLRPMERQWLVLAVPTSRTHFSR
jgi:hypothetical protein